MINEKENNDETIISDHLDLVLQFFTKSGSQNAEIVIALRKLYEIRGITHDPKTWVNASWPNLSDLHKMTEVK